MNRTTDWFDVERLADGRYQITEGKGHLPCHSFILTDGGEALLVDTGLGIGHLRSTVMDIAEDVPRVLLTHSHWDHIGAAHQFDDVVIDDRERGDSGRVAIDALTDEFDARPGQFAENWLAKGFGFPDGFDPKSYAIRPIDDVGAAEPGDELSVGSITLELVSIPGHSPGQLAAIDRDAGICFGADILEPGGKIHAHLERSDVDTYCETMDRLVALRDEGAFHTLTTGHCEPLHGDDLDILDDVQAALEAVAADAAPYEIIDTNFGPTREYVIDGVEVLTRA